MIAADAFWSVNATQVLMLTLMVSGFVVWFSRFEGRVRSTAIGLKTFSKETEETFNEQRSFMDKLLMKMEAMDREGTRKSQQSLAADEKIYELNSRRIDKLEMVMLDLSPKVAAMSANLDWIADKVRKNGGV